MAASDLKTVLSHRPCLDFTAGKGTRSEDAVAHTCPTLTFPFQANPGMELVAVLGWRQEFLSHSKAQQLRQSLNKATGELEIDPCTQVYYTHS